MEQPVMAQDSSPERDAHLLRNGVLWTVALLVLLLAIGLAVPDLREVLRRAAHASDAWLVAAVALEVGSCLGYVAIVRLVLRRGPQRELRWLAWAETAFGAFVPVGGAGGLALGAWAMRAWGIPWARIANRSAVIFLLTSAVNASVLALGGIGVALGIGVGNVSVVYGIVPAAVSIAGLAFFLALPWLAQRPALAAREGRLALVLRRMGGWVADTRVVAFTPDRRLLGAAAYLLCDIAVLWACLRAVGVSPPLLGVVVGYQVGYLANLLPIPGGVGALEGGLLGALVLYGLPAAPTAAAVVLYHTIALWVPAIGGTLGFARLRRAVTAAPAARAQLSAEERVAAAERLPEPVRVDVSEVAA